jgi:N utilization substance protein B
VARTPDPSEAEFVRRVREPRATSAEPGRHAARRAAMMVLYQVDVTDGDVERAIFRFQDEHDLQLPSYGEDIVRGVAGDLAGIDAAIQANLDGWTVDRLGAVERAVLRIATYELRVGDVPHEVVADEAVELAKRYSSPDAGKLVNGVLGGWIRSQGSDPSEEE